MKKKEYTLIMITVVAVFLSLNCNFNHADNKEKYKLKCHYMAYACGHCYAQYQIWEVEKAGSVTKKELLRKDLKVIFVNEDKVRKLDKLVSKCAICYDFYFEGTISKSLRDTFYTMLADTYAVKLRDSACCD